MRVTLSTKKRTQAPGSLVAKVKAAEVLQRPADSLKYLIVAQSGGNWMTWEVWS